MNTSVRYAQVVQGIESAGLANSVIALHSSLKSFGQVEGGSETVVRAFLDKGCTLVVPTFTYNCEVPPPPGWFLAQNGDAQNGDEGRSGFAEAVGFDLASPLIERSMGAIPAYILSLPERVRSDHPLNSFAAVGPQAADVIAAQEHLDVYGPYKKMAAWNHAYVLLIGVGLTSTTPIHFAEAQAGRRLFRRWAKQADGSTVEIEVGSCSNGFDQLDPVVREIEKTAQVGASRWRIFPFRLFIDTVAAAIRENPTITQCSDPTCARCRDMGRGGPLFSD